MEQLTNKFKFAKYIVNAGEMGQALNQSKLYSALVKDFETVSGSSSLSDIVDLLKESEHYLCQGSFEGTDIDTILLLCNLVLTARLSGFNEDIYVNAEIEIRSTHMESMLVILFHNALKKNAKEIPQFSRVALERMLRMMQPIDMFSRDYFLWTSVKDKETYQIDPQKDSLLRLLFGGKFRKVLEDTNTALKVLADDNYLDKANNDVKDYAAWLCACGHTACFLIEDQEACQKMIVKLQELQASGLNADWNLSIFIRKAYVQNFVQLNTDEALDTLNIARKYAKSTVGNQLDPVENIILHILACRNEDYSYRFICESVNLMTRFPDFQRCQKGVVHACSNKIISDMMFGIGKLDHKLDHKSFLKDKFLRGEMSDPDALNVYSNLLTATSDLDLLLQVQNRMQEASGNDASMRSAVNLNRLLQKLGQPASRYDPQLIQELNKKALSKDDQEVVAASQAALAQLNTEIGTPQYVVFKMFGNAFIDASGSPELRLQVAQDAICALTKVKLPSKFFM